MRAGGPSRIGTVRPFAQVVENSGLAFSHCCRIDEDSGESGVSICSPDRFRQSCRMKFGIVLSRSKIFVSKPLPEFSNRKPLRCVVQRTGGAYDWRTRAVAWAQRFSIDSAL